MEIFRFVIAFEQNRNGSVGPEYRKAAARCTSAVVPCSFVEVFRAVGGADDEDAAVGRGGVAALHLHQQLRLQPPAGLMLPCIGNSIIHEM